MPEMKYVTGLELLVTLTKLLKLEDLGGIRRIEIDTAAEGLPDVTVTYYPKQTPDLTPAPEVPADEPA